MGPAATARSHLGGVPGDWVYHMARPGADAGHHHAALPVANSAWQHGLQPPAPSVRLTVHGGGILSSPGQTPATLLWPPLGALQPRRAAIHLGRRAVAWASH